MDVPGYSDSHRLLNKAKVFFSLISWRFILNVMLGCFKERKEEIGRGGKLANPSSVKSVIHGNES